MQFNRTPWLRAAFAVLATLAAGFGMAACSNSATFALEPGDYIVIGAVSSSTLTDNSETYIYAPVTVADDHTITGTAKLYVNTYAITSVQTADDTMDVTGEVTADSASILFSNETADVTGTATVAADGTVNVALANADDETFLGNARLIEKPAADVAIACGYFYFAGNAGAFQGPAMYLGTEDGDLFGVWGGNYHEDNTFTGTLDGTFDAGTGCSSNSCNTGFSATASGELDDGTAESFDIEGGGLYWTASSPTYMYIGQVGFANDDFEGFFRGDSYHCNNTDFD